MIYAILVIIQKDHTGAKFRDDEDGKGSSQERTNYCKGTEAWKSLAWLGTYSKWCKMKTELLENNGEFKDSEKVKGLRRPINKSAFRAAKSYGPIASFDRQLRGFVCALGRKLAVCGLGSFSLQRKVSLSELCAWNIAQYSSLSRAELQRAPRAYWVANYRKQVFRVTLKGATCVAILWVLGIT